MLSVVLGDQLDVVISKVQVLDLQPPETKSLRVILNTMFEEYLLMTKYAASQATCQVFEQELQTFIRSKFGVGLREDLTEATIYKMWLKLFDSIMDTLNEKIESLRIQYELGGQTFNFVIPNYLVEK